MLKRSSKYAITCGLFLLGFFALAYSLGSNPFLNLSHLFFDILILGMFLFFACKEYKSYANGGYLHFWQGMSIGFIVYFSATVIFTIGLTLYFLINPDFLSEYKIQAMDFLLERKDIYLEKFSQERFDEQVKAIENVSTFTLMRGTVVKKLLAGLFVTPVISIILRKNKLT